MRLNGVICKRCNEEAQALGKPPMWAGWDKEEWRRGLLWCPETPTNVIFVEREDIPPRCRYAAEQAVAQCH